jgi:NifU-like protein involved in Fe-S cluster formation
VRALFADLAHAGDLPLTDDPGVLLYGEGGSQAAGTQVRFVLRMGPGQVYEARYRAYGCPYTLASCEWLARRLAGVQLREASAAGLTAAIGGPLEWAAALDIPAERLGRLLIIEDALRSALLQRSIAATDPCAALTRQ